MFTRVSFFFRELAKLRKDHRKKENQIRSLQADARRKEIMLKRRNEEVCQKIHNMHQYITHAACAI